jgi:hypothetical protein
MIVAVYGVEGIAVMTGKDGVTLDGRMRPSSAARFGRTIGFKRHESPHWETVLSNGTRIPATEASTRSYENAPILRGTAK